MATVNLRVEFGFDKDSAGEYIWNDITAYVRNVSLDRGKSDELSAYNAGGCTVVLENNTRMFDPSNDASPYQSQIRPAGGLRVFLDDTQVFDGFIDDWNLSYNLDTTSEATIQAYDGFGKLNLAPVSYTPTVELSSARVNAVLNQVAWPVSKRNISTGGATLNADPLDNVSALSYLQQVETSESGRLFMDRSGNVVFKSMFDGFYESQFTELRTNLCLNPGFESNADSWVGSVARSTAQALFGSASGSVSAGSAVTIPFDGDANTTYALSVYAYSVAGGTVVLNGLGGTANTVEASTAVSVPATTWTRCGVAYLSSFDIHALQVTPSTGMFIDGVLIENTTSVGEYFDGTIKPSDTDTITYTTEWNV